MYIEREALQKKIGEEFDLNYGEILVDPYVFAKMVENAPAADVAPVVHGEWEWRMSIPWCSNCEKMLPGYSYDGDVNTTPYCPNCGAKMDGGKHETD